MKSSLGSRLTPGVLLLLCAAPLPAQQTIPSFKAETNLVLVPVVVRDAKGEVVGNLSKDDFRLFDNGHERPITTFAVEETSGRAAQDRSVGDGPKSAPVVIPEHFAALMFDDAHFDTGRYEDIVYSRNAALKYLETLQPADRVALFTSSGQYDVDFTADRSKIKAALMKIAPGQTFFYGLRPEQVARLIIQQCEKIIHRMSLLPGQRTLVFVSSGLPVHGADWSAVPEVMRLVDSAIRSRVVVSGMDTRGLSAASPTTRAWEFQLDMADGTGGKFIRDTNDLDGATRQLAAAPKSRYILGFSPEGQRSVLLLSPGLFVPPDLQNESDELMALAIRDKVLINVVDARGVWTNAAFEACRGRVFRTQPPSGTRRSFKSLEGASQHAMH
jgi:VWFA-related protein